MSLHLYNTLTRSLERFKPLKQEEVKVYYCGPTPYNYAHIGNLRNYLMDDIVVRTMRFLWYKVRTVMNVTDIDDKTIRDSQESKEKKSLKEFTEFYTNEFLADCARLAIVPADIIAPISTLIPDMVSIIQWLLDKGYAYIADDRGIYYSVNKFKKYGELAHIDVKWMISSVRIDNDEYEKEQVADFALWKWYSAFDGDNRWDVTFRILTSKVEQLSKSCLDGFVIEANWEYSNISMLWRPGWHIECSACNMKFHGAQIDIHMGGCDLIFPHHQNEVAQTEAYTGKKFANYWLHGGHLLVDDRKMSKSSGNFYTLRDIFNNKVLNYMVKIDETLICRWFRLMALQNQYRENFNFTFGRLQAGMNTIKWLDEMIKRLGRYRDNLSTTTIIDEDIERELTAKWRYKFHEITREFRENQQTYMQEWVERLEDDFDTLGAMTLLYEYQTYINTGIDDELFSLGEIDSLIGLLKSWNEVIAILDFDILDQIESIPNEITVLLIDRNEAKINKNYAEADRIRDELDRLGYKIIDEKNGSRVEKL